MSAKLADDGKPRLFGLPFYLTLDEAAELARVSVETVRWWCKKSGLRSFRPGGRGKHRVIRRDDMIAFIESEPAE